MNEQQCSDRKKCVKHRTELKTMPNSYKMRPQIASDQELPSMLQANSSLFQWWWFGSFTHARPAQASSPFVIFIRGKTTTRRWKEYAFSNVQKQAISWTECFKEPFLSTLASAPPFPLWFRSASSLIFSVPFGIRVTLSVTLLHCNVRGICETTDLLNIPRAILFGGSQTVTLRLTWI